MDIVHVDPGYGRLMKLESNTELESVENSTYNPYSSVAFTATQGARTYFPVDLTFEPTAGQFYKKVWSLKLSVYNDSGSFYVGFCRSIASFSNPDVGVHLSGNTCHIRRYVDGTVDEEKNFAATPAGLHHISITYSLTSEATGNYLLATTIMVDNTTDFQIYSSATAPPTIQYLGCSFSISAQNHCFISNVLVGQASYEGDGTGSIPSDDGIPANTPVYRLPLGTPVTDFEAGEDGEYIAKENGQTLLQTVNASSLVTTHGNRPINHIVAYGNPGYRVGTAVTAATGISKEGSVITPHGTHTLSFEKDMHVYDVWKIAEGSTFNDINGLQVGWRAGE